MRSISKLCNSFWAVSIDFLKLKSNFHFTAFSRRQTNSTNWKNWKLNVRARNELNFQPNWISLIDPLPNPSQFSNPFSVSKTVLSYENRPQFPEPPTVPKTIQFPRWFSAKSTRPITTHLTLTWSPNRSVSTQIWIRMRISSRPNPTHWFLLGAQMTHPTPKTTLATPAWSRNGRKILPTLKIPASSQKTTIRVTVRFYQTIFMFTLRTILLRGTHPLTCWYL